LASCQALAYGWVLSKCKRWDWFRWCSKSSRVECRSPENLRFESNVTDLRVIAPSAGQTGTTSVMNALRELGLRAYHSEDYSSMAKLPMFDKVAPAAWAGAVSRCRMEAMALEPVMDMLPLALSRSPKAKVILTWRDYPSWKKSTDAGGAVKDQRTGYVIYHLMSSHAVLPWIQLADRWTGVFQRLRLEGRPLARPPEVASWLFRQLCNGYSWPIMNVNNRGTYKIYGQEEAYLAHIDEIRRITPPPRLLEVDVKNVTWRQLEEFLGLPPTRGGAALPKSRSKLSRTNDPYLDSLPPQVVLGILILTSMHALNYFAVALVGRLAALVLWALFSC